MDELFGGLYQGRRCQPGLDAWTQLGPGPADCCYFKRSFHFYRLNALTLPSDAAACSELGATATQFTAPFHADLA